MFYLNLQGDAGLAKGVHGVLNHASCFMFVCFSHLKHFYLHSIEETYRVGG